MGPAVDRGRIVGRYALYDEIASGGMATIHLGRMLGQAGFARTVAIKRLHPHFAKDPEFVAMFIDEARLAAGVRHPNVVATLDVVALEGELFLVMEYVEGDSLSHLVREALGKGAPVEPRVACAIMCNVLYGLHAAHVAKDERGEPLHIVHRDVSPQNVLVGVDGVARVLDFGVAKAARRMLETEAGRIKGKFRYMAPEQIRAERFDHRVDVFAAGTVLWEVLTGRGLFQSDEPMRTMSMILEHPIPPPSTFVPGIAALDPVVLRALERDPARRHQTARELAIDLENVLPPAVPRVVGEWVESLVGEKLKSRAARLVEIGSEPAAPAYLPEIGTPSCPSASGQSVPSVSSPRQSMPSASSLGQSMPSAGQSMASASSPGQSTPSASSRGQSTPSASSHASSAERPRAEPSSQVSEVSVAAWDTAPKRSFAPVSGRTLRALLIGVAAALGLFVLVLTGLLLRQKRSTSEAEKDVVDVAPNPEKNSAGARSISPPANPTPIVTAEPDTPGPLPSAAASAAPPSTRSGATVSAPASKASPSRPAPANTASPKKQRSDCDPPYTIGMDGIKKFKRHCL